MKILINTPRLKLLGGSLIIFKIEDVLVGKVKSQYFVFYMGNLDRITEHKETKIKLGIEIVDI